MPSKEVSQDLIQFAERLAACEHLCATDESKRRDWDCYIAALARFVALFKQKLASITGVEPLVSPELRAWMLTQNTPEELIAGLIEVREQGGKELGEVIQALKQKRRDRERANS